MNKAKLIEMISSQILARDFHVYGRGEGQHHFLDCGWEKPVPIEGSFGSQGRLPGETEVLDLIEYFETGWLAGRSTPKPPPGRPVWVGRFVCSPAVFEYFHFWVEVDEDGWFLQEALILGDDVQWAEDIFFPRDY